jgi:large subunit ribosomal protein L29
MKNAELKNLTLEDLTSKIKEEKELLQKLKFAHALSPIENPMRIRASRKAIAQMMTELNARKASK